jgi:hypothetical protein
MCGFELFQTNKTKTIRRRKMHLFRIYKQTKSIKLQAGKAKRLTDYMSAPYDF